MRAPQSRSTHLVRERVYRDTKGTGETKVTQLELALRVDEQVLRLEIAVQDLVLVTEGRALEKLVHEGADDVGAKRAAVAVLVHVPLEIAVAELENERELGLGVDHVVEADDVDVLELLHERDLADCS